MVDFQNDGLESQVYELIAKMCDLMKSDEFPKFQTKQLPDGFWECTLSIPGVKNTAFGTGKTEVHAINRCSRSMLTILKSKHKNDEYDPDIKESVFREQIEERFGNVEYNPEYFYYPFFCGMLLEDKYDGYLKRSLMNHVKPTLERIEEEGGEVVKMCDIVDLVFLVRRKKKNYA